MAKLHHRGPDFQNIKIRSNVALGHARLSIIDLSPEANQPFEDETGRYHLIFNGEIYNYRELRKQMETDGVKFRTNSDTEVLLRILIREGVSGISRLNGFFAFLFFDTQLGELIAARDRLGIKPLLYCIEQDKIILSSELKPFLEFDIDKSLDKKSVADLFRFTYVPAPNTVLSAVKKMPAGHYALVSERGFELKSYYQLTSHTRFQGTYDEAKKSLRELLEDSVSLRLISDVPAGSFLSGGVDSSVIAALAKKQKTDLRTFSIGFDHPYFNESAFAEETAAYLGTDHSTLVLSKDRFRGEFPAFLDSLDEPFADSSAFAVYLLSQYTRNYVTVSLSGDGADELFGGYRKHMAEASVRSDSVVKKMMIRAGASILGEPARGRSGSWGNFRRKLTKYASGSSMNTFERYLEWCSWIPKDDRMQLLIEPNGDEHLEESRQILTLNDYLICDQQFVLPNDMLKKVDAMSMAHGLEARVPFLDHRIVEFANSLPVEFKFSPTRTKTILRETFAGMLPESVFHRAKKGFEIPLAGWLDTELESLLDKEYFSRDYIEEQGIFKYDYIETIKKDKKEALHGERIYLIWTLIVFQHWYHHSIFTK